MAESYPIETHFAPTYASNIELLLQQKSTRFLPHVMVGYHSGEQASVVDQIGALNMTPRSGRLTPISFTEAQTDRRWVRPQPYELAQPCDKYDKLRTVMDFQSAYVQNGFQAAQRAIDDEIIDAFFGTALTGKDATTSTAFDSTNQLVAVTEGSTAATGLNMEKILAAVEILMGHEAVGDGDELCLAYSATQWRDLMGDQRMVGGDYRINLPIETGSLGRPLGLTLVHSERLPVDSNSYRRNPMWVKSGVHFAFFDSLMTDIDYRKDLVGHPIQIYQQLTIDATRTDEEKVVEIKCSEA